MWAWQRGGGGCQMLTDAHVGEEGKFELLTWAFQKLMKLKHTYLTILICWTQKNHTQQTLEISLQTNQFLSQWNSWNCSIVFFATAKSWYASYSQREGLQNRRVAKNIENATLALAKDSHCFRGSASFVPRNFSSTLALHQPWSEQ